MLTAEAIKFHVERGSIVVDPFDEDNLNPNSYDLHLGNEIRWYVDKILDPKKDNQLYLKQQIPSGGFLLQPESVFLVNTVEYTESHKHIPMINGRSSLARLGLSVHQTGGFGDIGFCGNWTLELSVVQPVYVYPGMGIAQVCWFEPEGLVLKKYDGKYQGQTAITPSRMHMELK